MLIFIKHFIEDYEKNVFVTGEDTMKNLIKIIDENKFESGACVENAHYKLH